MGILEFGLLMAVILIGISVIFVSGSQKISRGAKIGVLVSSLVMLLVILWVLHVTQ